MAMNNEGYLIPQEGVWIWLNPHGGMLYTTTKLTYKLNNDAVEIIKYCNGEAAFDEILKLLQLEGKKLTSEDIEKIRSFIYNLVNMNILQISSVPLPKKILLVGESEVFQPIHCTVELTNACNLKCNYCYYDADNNKNKGGYLTNPIKFFSNLYKHGIRIVELSGGEPLLHPEIYSILEFTGNTFTHIALLTNGLLLSNNILKLVENYGKRFTLQVSIPSIKPERFYKITGADVWNKVFNNIMRLTEYHITFRIATVIVDEESVSEIKEIAYFAKSVGAKMFGVVPYMALGRARFLPPIPPQSLALLGEELKTLESELPNFVGIIEGEFPDRNANNCGAGSRTITFDYLGRSRPCPLFPENFCRFAFHDNKLLRQRIAEVISPREEVCGDCRFINFCRGCILRGWLQFNKSECLWGKNQKIQDIFNFSKTDG